MAWMPQVSLPWSAPGISVSDPNFPISRRFDIGTDHTRVHNRCRISDFRRYPQSQHIGQFLTVVGESKYEGLGIALLQTGPYGPLIIFKALAVLCGPFPRRLLGEKLEKVELEVRVESAVAGVTQGHQI